MKRFFIWITAVVMALSCVTVAFAAGYSKLDNLTPGQVGYVLGQLLTEKTGNYVYDVPWYADSYDYRVIVSYDSLSELCSTANGLGMFALSLLTLSIHLNCFPILVRLLRLLYPKSNIELCSAIHVIVIPLFTLLHGGILLLLISIMP